MQLRFIIQAATAFLLVSPSAALLPRSEENGPCTNAAGVPGVCIPTAKCTQAGGSFTSNRCPGTPEDIKCCTKTSCSTNGNCRWTSQCASGNTISNLCPGPANFKCCISGSPPPSGGYPAPNTPGVGACKASAVNGARRTVNAFPGKVREIGCYRNCGCPGNSDHCCGLAIDYMVSDRAGIRTEAGRPIAEWAMNNRGSLNVKYIIWGQRIWNPSRDSVRPWSQWRLMEDRGDNTQNHWDHVHISYN